MAGAPQGPVFVEADPADPAFAPPSPRQVPDALLDASADSIEIEGSRVDFRPLCSENVGDLKRLNSVLFPINYNDKIYEQCMQSGRCTQLAYVGNELVGAIACRLEARAGGAACYIATLGVHAPYRGQCLGTVLLHRAMQACRDDDAIGEALLHVQTNNDAALKFYLRNNFRVLGVVKNYYRRIAPPDAWLLRLRLRERG
ncbi:unnamed protein product [Pedinophyceae sp. YPF-701]|nr:unnamed protein product [Pedinophyceae sp. YPF-701]